MVVIVKGRVDILLNDCLFCRIFNNDWFELVNEKCNLLVFKEGWVEFLKLFRFINI